MALQPIKFGTENTVDKNWTAQPIPFRNPNLHQSSANLSHANETWATMTHQQKLLKSQADAEAAKKVSDEANSAGGIAKETIKGTAKSLIDPAFKFIGSAIKAPVDIVRNFMGMNPLDGDMSSPTGTKFKSIQSDFAEKDVPAVMSGTESPLEATTNAVGQTLSGAGDVLTAGELGGSKLVKMGSDFVEKKLTSSAEKKVAAEALDVVTPKLTKKETEAALAAGRGKGGGLFSKTKITPDKRLLDVADATKGIVRKGASGAENISSVKKALTTEADTLAKNVEKIKQPVSEKGVKTFLDGVEKPIEIKADATLNRKFDITKNALMKIVSKNEKTVSGLLKSRKEFDALVEKEFPNLYDKENSSMRSSVTGMRNALNDSIESNLPDGFGYKESLKKQSLFYDAIDNIAGKSTEEVGTSKAGRVVSAIKKHPVAAGMIGYGAYKAEQEIKDLTGL